MNGEYGASAMEGTAVSEAVSAAQVKALRERTGAGMMDCKKALVEAGGDLEAAVEAMRKSGLAAADRKAGRVAAEGLVAIESDGARAAMVEVNCETDFVAREEEFGKFARDAARAVLAEAPADPQALGALPLDGGATVEERRRELVARIGENIAVRRFSLFDPADGARAAAYSHHGGRIGVLVEVAGGGDGAEAAGRDVAMHVAASRPLGVDESDLPDGVLARERSIVEAQSQGSGKPPEIVEKMVSGRMRKFVAESTLLGQPFVKDPDVTVGKYLAGHGASVNRFVRFEVGEGIERREDDFVGEVMAQVRKNA